MGRSTPAVAVEEFPDDAVISVAVVACGVALPLVVYVKVTVPVGAPTEELTVAVNATG
jgi:hypothetical protein